ncbi:glycosyl hydrolase, family 13, all-beta [Artemisia annua]|uniref:Glycosyl hydrolase, family 13, all-beta n=1 Tax=Artemisia annua TaxID=35608 RepID=A0A2U1NKI9_ARTAN|nr:glycosyl hydrolase, family 13, all-beta [Artemisia annua]
MGNEFGHPEWIDFPRVGNDWSYDKCRRQWELVDTEHLRYKFMNAFDRAMNLLDEKFSFLSSTKQIVSSADEDDKVYKVGCDLPGKYKVALDSDAFEFGGHGRVGHDVDHFTSPEGTPGVPETNFNNRPNSFKVLSPPRTCVVYYRVEEDRVEETEASVSLIEDSDLDDVKIIKEATPVTESKAQVLEISEEEKKEDHDNKRLI